jgi:hypothetical protein
LSLEPISRPRLYRIDHNAKFSWWWHTIQSKQLVADLVRIAA